MNVKKIFIAGFLAVAGLSGRAQTSAYKEVYRPQFHFSPPAKWMNDPNGMVFYKGVYHLFYQYYPNGTTWGPMHWGHATSKNLVTWKNQPVALYPDSLGYIFSGSAVVDKSNTAGFGKDGKIPLVAIFTHHDPKGESQKRKDYQNQSIAYSLDEGKTWTKYAGNPVLKNPGIVDFRDPKVMWYEKGNKWIMTLAAKDRIAFYSSPDLKEWKKESEFGETVGAHGGVWECPDLFPLSLAGKTYWVLIVNINPGGPNNGSATQYFIGDFDGSNFKPMSTQTKWADWGADEYAGITWSNTGDRKIFLGWMSNWMYAEKVPTEAWRSATTIPRELGLKKVENELFLTSKPVKEMDKLVSKTSKLGQTEILSSTPLALSDKVKSLKSRFKLEIATDQLKDYTLILFNDLNEEIRIGYDKQANHYFIDRTKAGKSDFSNGFAARHTAPRFSKSTSSNLILYVDVASVELFADDGLTVMTDICFPNKPWNRLSIRSREGIVLSRLNIAGIKSIWE